MLNKRSIIMAANNELSKEADGVEVEVAKGEQNEVLEEQRPSEKEKIREEPRSKLKSKKLKQPTARKAYVKRVSPRIDELARPQVKNVLVTLKDKALVLPPAFVDNLTKIIGEETCINPEEAARILRKKRKAKKKTKISPLMTKWDKEITKLEEVKAPPMLDKDMTVCQYLLAVNFVHSILERKCQTPREDLRKLTRVIFKRLKSVDEYTDDGNNSDRVTQQLQVLSEIIACWIAEMLAEVAEVEKETLEEYCKKKKIRKIDVDDDEETDSEAEYWEQIEKKYEMQKKAGYKVTGKENKEKEEVVEDEKIE